MENLNSKKSNFEQIVLALLILFAASIIFVGFSAWQAMSRGGNESNAIDFVSAVVKAQREYANVHQGNFARNFDELVETVSLDEKLSGEKPTVLGYVFEMQVKKSSVTEPPFFSVRADPKISEGFFATGEMHFYFDSTLKVVKFTSEDRPANAND